MEGMVQPYLRWRQDDARLNQAEAWPTSSFPNATYHYFRDCGCLVCALAVMLRHCSLEKESDEGIFDPWVLNQRLVDCGAFDSAADLELESVGRLYPLEYVGKVPCTHDALAKVATDGSPCLVAVPGKKASKHFTTLLRVLKSDAKIYDPLEGVARLSSYDQPHELRVFRFAEGTER